MRRQRGALRVVQLTLLAVAVMLGLLAWRAWDGQGAPASPLDGSAPSGPAEVAVLGGLAVLAVAGSLAIGVRTVRGPEPPVLE